MGELTGVCHGRYIIKHTYNPAAINALTESGASKEEVLNSETPRSVRIRAYHILYEYEVNGRTYVRADHKQCHRKDKYIAMASYAKYIYNVYYDPANPAVAQIGDKIGVADTASGSATPTTSSGVPLDNSPILALVFGILAQVLSATVIPSLVLGPLGLVKAIKVLRTNDPRKMHAIIGMVLSCSGILSAITFLIVGIAVLYQLLS